MLFIYAALTLFLLTAIYTDITRFIIPNWLVGLVIALYPVAVFLSPTEIDWLAAIGAFGLLFLIGFVFFSLKIMGGGDVKLIAACGLWTGLEHIIPFVLYTAIIGGILSVILLLARPLTLWVLIKAGHEKDRAPKILLPGEPVPYGIAISSAMIWMLWFGELAIIL